IGCGKNSLVERFVTNLFAPNRMKGIGVNFEVKSFNLGKQKIKLNVWDFGQEKRAKSVLPTYIRGARGGLFMYDITNYFSLAHIDDWFPIIMVGGKADLANEREVGTQEGRQIAKSQGFDGFIECSSKSGENVEKTFKALTRLMMFKL
ncbi:MAG: GTP-binding protein, partial [Candidatus Lokiarchaeota archaeon]|nr:GTP-binding protein [Candidatus Lokiarchaeota archaeon]